MNRSVQLSIHDKFLLWLSRQKLWTIQLTENKFPVVLFIMLGKVDLTYLSSKMKIPKRYENNWVVLFSSAVRFAIIFSYYIYIFLHSQRQNSCILRTRGSTPNATNCRLYRCFNYRLELKTFFCNFFFLKKLCRSSSVNGSNTGWDLHSYYIS